MYKIKYKKTLNLILIFSIFALVAAYFGANAYSDKKGSKPSGKPPSKPSTPVKK